MYNVFISLGCTCAVARSMQKYGLRSFSGPFDWCISEFRSILHTLETDFDDFLYKDNLQPEESIAEIKYDYDCPIYIRDKKYNFLFTHEVQANLEKEYDSIYEKYNRRINKFRELRGNDGVGKKICFLRSVMNTEEICYIQKNVDYINSIIQNTCIENDIIFLIPYYLKIPDNFPFHYFILQLNCYPSFREGLKNLFDTNGELISYLIAHIDEGIRKNNLLFSLEAEVRSKTENSTPAVNIERRALLYLDSAYEKLHCFEDKLIKAEEKRRISDSRYKRLLMLVKKTVNREMIPSRIIIYGAGDIGKLFYEKIKDFCCVSFFVDANPMESEFNGIPIKNVIEINAEAVKDTEVAIIPTYDKLQIMNALKCRCGDDVRCIPMEDFFI